VQFGVDQRRQLVEGRLVAITPGAQQPGYFHRRGRHKYFKPIILPGLIFRLAL
jgi:hypothetical protein